MPCTSELYPPFTLDQLNVLSAWGAARPLGLSVTIDTGHPYFPEMAVLCRSGKDQVRYLVNPTSRGTVVVVRLPTGRWELPTVGTALAKVLAMEQWSAEA